MRHFVSIFILGTLIFGSFSCKEKDIPKPDHLLPEKQVTKMLIDIHLAKAIDQHQFNVPDSLKLTSTDLYYSVLKKYNVPDSIFVRSVIYYSSYPKQYEKMYNDVINELKVMEQDSSKVKDIKIGSKELRELNVK